MRISAKIKSDYDLFTKSERAKKKSSKDLFLNSEPSLSLLLNEHDKIWIRIINSIKDEKEEKSAEVRLKEIDAQIEIILKKHKLTKQEFFSEHYCPICRDTGYTNGAICRCLSSFASERAYSDIAFGQMLKTDNFSTFDLSKYSNAPDKVVEQLSGGVAKSEREYAEYNKKICERFAQIDKTRSLFIAGGVGTGKTFLASAVAKEMIDRGKSVIFTSAYNLIEDLTKISLGQAEEGRMENYMDCDLLIIDDLGCERQTDYSQMVLLNLINERILRGARMIITTNLSTKELKSSYNERITSRLYGEFWGIRTLGADLRKKE